MPKISIPMTTSTYSQKMLLQPAKYTMQLAKTNDSGQSTLANGSLYALGRSGSFFRRPASDSGAIAYISTVAEVTRATSATQLGNGKNVSIPMTKQIAIDQIGTPRLLM